MKETKYPQNGETLNREGSLVSHEVNCMKWLPKRAFSEVGLFTDDCLAV